MSFFDGLISKATASAKVRVSIVDVAWFQAMPMIFLCAPRFAGIPLRLAKEGLMTWQPVTWPDARPPPGRPTAPRQCHRLPGLFCNHF